MYSLLFISFFGLFNIVMNPNLFPKLKYNCGRYIVKDLIFIQWELSNPIT